MTNTRNTLWELKKYLQPIFKTFNIIIYVIGASYIIFKVVGIFESIYKEYKI